jgi:hypothetical protein
MSCDLWNLWALFFSTSSSLRNNTLFSSTHSTFSRVRYIVLFSSHRSIFFLRLHNIALCGVSFYFQRML